MTLPQSSAPQRKPACVEVLLPLCWGAAMAAAPAGPGTGGPQGGWQGLSWRLQPEMAAGSGWEGPGSWCPKSQPAGLGSAPGTGGQVCGDRPCQDIRPWVEAQSKLLGRHSWAGDQHHTGPGRGWEPWAEFKQSLGPVGLGRPRLRLVRARWCSQGWALWVPGGALACHGCPKQAPWQPCNSKNVSVKVLIFLLVMLLYLSYAVLILHYFNLFTAFCEKHFQ